MARQAARAGRLARLGVASLALGFAGAALALGVQHPVAPWPMCWFLLLVAWRVFRAPGAWLFWLPALLPVLHFSPWTGWWLLDESDLMVLAILASGYARWARDLHTLSPNLAWPGWRGGQGLGWLCLALACLGVLGVWRGLHDAGGLGLNLFSAGFADIGAGLYAGYDSAWNTLRVGKSLLWALLLLPLMRHRPAQGEASGGRQLARGMVAGLALTCLVVLLERQLYAGVFDFSRTYRTSAWFWEMHVGGGAIDAYLALAAPFALWAVWTAPRGVRWWAAQGLLWLTVYVVLTTYSRGIYLATLIALAWMAFAAWRWQIPAAAGAVWRRRALLAVALVVLVESAVVLGAGGFMGQRLAQANTDLVGRLAHWRAGLSLIGTPGDAWLGIGLGRLPAHYSHEVPGGEFPGAVRWWRDATGQPLVQVEGPATRADLGSHFALTQRVALQTDGAYTVRLKADPGQPGLVMLTLCVRHLLYSEQCQGRLIGPDQPPVDASGWREVVLEGSPFQPSHRWGGSLRGVWALSVVEPGHALDLRAVELVSPGGEQVLLNPRFADGLQHWLPSARAHFYPWHIDNLYLETLIERGGLGLVVLGTWIALAAWGMYLRLSRADVLAWVTSASLLSLLALGMVISVWEVPRVALLGLVLLWHAHPKAVQME